MTISIIPTTYLCKMGTFHTARPREGEIQWLDKCETYEKGKKEKTKNNHSNIFLS